MKYNLNDRVRVTLTLSGHAQLNKYRRNLIDKYPDLHFKNLLPDGDTFTCQFWKLFEIFEIGLGFNPIDMNVELLDKLEE